MSTDSIGIEFSTIEVVSLDGRIHGQVQSVVVIPSYVVLVEFGFYHEAPGFAKAGMKFKKSR